MNRSKPILLVAALLSLARPSFARPADFLGKSAADWARDLDSNKPAARRSAAFALGKIGSDADTHLPQLAAHIQNESDAGVREAAAAAIGEVIQATKGRGRGYWDATAPALRIGLKDASPTVRRSAAYALGTFGQDSKDAEADLKAALSDDSPAVRQNAAWALGRLGAKAGEDTVDQLCKLLHDPDALVRRDAATALGDIGLPAAAKAWKPLMELVRTEAPKRDAADDVLLRTALRNMTVLIDNQNKKVVEALMPLYNANSNAADIQDRLRAAIDPILKNLGGIGLPDAKAAREDALARYRETLKQAMLDPVLVALKDLENLAMEENRKLASRFDPLVQLLDKDDPASAGVDETAMLAAFALARVGGPTAEKALAVLKHALRDPDPQLQEQAAIFLGEMGPAAAPAAAALGDALQADRAIAVRAQAAIALAKVGPEAVKVTPQLLKMLKTPDTPETRERQLRKLAAEVFLYMGYPSSRDALPTLLDVIAHDADPQLTQRCVDVFLFMKPEDFPSVRSSDGRSAEAVLTAVLSDPRLANTPRVRYNAARALAVNLREKTPEKAISVLLDMLKDTDLQVYHGTESTVTKLGTEGTGGATKTEMRAAGDARYLAAISLGQIGVTAKRQDVLTALQEATNDTKDTAGLLKIEAKNALKKITGIDP